MKTGGTFVQKLLHHPLWPFSVCNTMQKRREQHSTSTDTNIDIGYKKCNYFFQPISRRTCHTHRISCPQSSTTTIPTTSQDQSNVRLIFGKVKNCQNEDDLKRSLVSIFHNSTKLKSIIRSVIKEVVINTWLVIKRWRFIRYVILTFKIFLQ
jgi:hypothetical protein